MKTICLVACTSKKALKPTTAADLYRSPLFEGARWFAENRCDSWYILSAKYGLLAPNEEVLPYDESLNGMAEPEKIQWTERVNDRLVAQIKEETRIVFLAGLQYRKYLQRHLHDAGIETQAPLSELGIGRQVAWLQKLVTEQKRLSDLDRFYGLLARLAATGSGAAKLKECSSTAVPSQGIYFFWQAGENRMTAPFDGRVVRIGTHAVSEGSRATLWNRLRTHRGGKEGSGNHRGSIFRLHVGQALLRKTEREAELSTWGVGQSAPAHVREAEAEMELEVSQIIGEMPVLWIGVSDRASPDSDRAYLERNLIALVAGATGPFDLPTTSWLGNWSSRDAIPTSGLWNVNYVKDDYDPVALDVFERYIEVAEGTAATPSSSLAPTDWRTRTSKNRIMKHQLNLV
jgi:hypothetical protein